MFAEINCMFDEICVIQKFLESKEKNRQRKRQQKTNKDKFNNRNFILIIKSWLWIPQE